MSDFYQHPTAILDDNVKVGAGTKVWHFVHILSEASIGEGSTLGQNVMVGQGVTIGNKVKIQNNVSVYSGVTLEDEVFVGPSAVFTNVVNPRSAIERKNYVPTLVKKGATIGANATIVCGTTIGQHAFIGAGAVVTRDVANFELVHGVPAVHAGWMSAYGHKLDFNDHGKAKCPESGQWYELAGNIVKEVS